MRTLFQPGYFGYYRRPRIYIPSKIATRSVTVHLLNSPATPTDVASVSLSWQTQVTRGGAIVDSGTTSTNGSGQLILTGLSISAGAGFVQVWDPANSLKDHRYPVTFV